MNDITVSVVGTVLTEPRMTELKSGGTVTSFRIACNSRRFNRQTSQWEDGESSYFTVNCWRQLADNTAKSLLKGDPVLVVGRLRLREWSTAERAGTSIEIDANHVGHDLSRGVASFRRIRRETSAATQIAELAASAGVRLADVDADLVDVDAEPEHLRPSA